MRIENNHAELCGSGVAEATGSPESMARREVEFWEPYDLIWSALPTVDKALYQVLGFLEMRCD